MLAQSLASELRWQSAKVKRASISCVLIVELIMELMFGFTLLAAVRKHLLLKARPSCRDKLTRFSSAFLLHRQSYGRGIGPGRGRGVGVARGIAVAVGVAVAVAVAVAVGVAVAVAVGVGVGLG